MTDIQALFHLAFPVNDISETENFFVKVIGCSVGRRSDKWIDFNFFGHQISAHLKPEEAGKALTNKVDGDSVPVRHFGLVLPWEEWYSFSEKLKKNGIQFLIEPHIRFKGKVGEQATLFILDPSGNALEFKSFKNDNMLFAS